MMKFLLLPLMLLLAACGGNEEFTIELDRPSNEVAAALADLDGGKDSGFAIYRTQVEKTRGDPHTLGFRFVAPKDDGQQDPATEANVLFRLEAIDGGRTRIAVEVDVPEVKYNATGTDMVLSERKVARELKKALEDYGTALNTGGDGGQALLKVDYLFAAIALSLDKKSLESMTSPQWGAVDFNGLAVDGFSEPDTSYGEPMDTPTPSTYQPASYEATGGDAASYEGAGYETEDIDGGWGEQ